MPLTAKHRRKRLCSFPTVIRFPTRARAFGGKKGRRYVLHQICKLWIYTSVHDMKFHTSAAPVRKSPGHLNPSFMLEEKQSHHAHPFLGTLSLFPQPILPYLLSDNNIQHYWLCCGAISACRHWACQGSKHFSSPFSAFSPSTLNKWPSLMKLWLLLHFHFVLLHACGRGQSLPWRVDQLNSKEWAWKRIYILHLTIGHEPTQRSNMSMEATAGLLVTDVHLHLSTEGKRWPFFKEKSFPIIATWNSSAKRHFLKLGQVRRTKGNRFTQ